MSSSVHQPVQGLARTVRVAFNSGLMSVNLYSSLRVVGMRILARAFQDACRTPSKLRTATKWCRANGFCGQPPVPGGPMQGQARATNLIIASYRNMTHLSGTCCCWNWGRFFCNHWSSRATARGAAWARACSLLRYLLPELHRTRAPACITQSTR